MTTSDQVFTSITNHVATVTFNRPRKGNSITPAIMEYLFKVLPDLATDPDVRVLVFTGVGKYFCTGLDLSDNVWHANEPTMQRLAWFSNNDIKLVEMITTFPKPVIARINGPALGGGLLFVFASDIRFAIDTAYFAFPEVPRGFLPKFTPPSTVNQLGKHKVMEYVLTGRRIPVSEAAESFLNGVEASDAALDRRVKSCTDMLVDAPLRVVTDAKKLIDVTANGGDKNYQTRVLLATQEINERVMQRHEATDGLKSFNASKRKSSEIHRKQSAGAKL